MEQIDMLNQTLSSGALLACLFGALLASSCKEVDDPHAHTHTHKTHDSDSMIVVEASCGQCQFGLPGEGCDLAVRVDGVAYYVDGSAIDDHGDAHAPSGLCNAIRTAMVEGNVEDDRFVATSFALRPAESDG